MMSARDGKLLNREFRNLSIKAALLIVYMSAMQVVPELCHLTAERVTAESHNFSARKLEFSGLPRAMFDLHD